jgi:hypothetical protein
VIERERERESMIEKIYRERERQRGRERERERESMIEKNILGEREHDIMLIFQLSVSSS